ncbi:MAG: hypothetical protein L0K65_07570 [Actinomyces sp.]|nr:hypothetical protein [Propionibacterium sp.]MDN6566894.1 hypothetical protein [Actinomyces sp.]
MTRVAIPVGQVEARAIAAVKAIAQERGIAPRALILGAGISESRGYRIFDGQAATVSDFVDMCDFLHLVAWQVLRDAEGGVEKRPLVPVPDLPPEVYGQPPAYDIERMAAQEGDVEREQEGSQETP